MQVFGMQQRRLRWKKVFEKGFMVVGYLQRLAPVCFFCILVNYTMIVSATTIFFAVYEKTKRVMIDHGSADPVAHLAGGALADLAASFVYVPSEVIKARLQLQGRFNNPYFYSGYNYRSTLHAIQRIYAVEGWNAFYHGYKATLLRDVPFSAIQFALYESFKRMALKRYGIVSEDGIVYLETALECIVGGAAGGLAGAVTVPLDVVKTIMQTQVRSPEHKRVEIDSIEPRKPPTKTTMTTVASTTPTRYFSGIKDGLIWTWKNQGLSGLFKGLGPRFYLTSIQSALMFLIYERMLEFMETRSKDSRQLDVRI